ncbi:hypothetical protein TL16_g12388 [Triparma laevis f. inornata]|uniref:Serine aminopeptidase S33 domain-containing protein n=1 Tax=Triparma laevis f. inornata TaxID=1714386 RepID=A0A9W7EVZ1_9STRA|nr:hypothetical protein TL16_g12388 [Triparma laevis f. inornata]
MTITLNFLCYASVPSPFFSLSPSLNTYGTFSVILLLTLCVFCVFKRERIITFKENRSPLMSEAEVKVNLKKAFLFLFVYFALALPLHFFSKTMIYPGIIVDMWSETPPNDPDIYGEAFMFKSNHDGKDLNGYHPFKLPPANTWAPSYDGALEVVPVIMYGGNGGSGWENVFTSSFLQSDIVVYDIHSFSYRGYEPNTGMGLPSETNILEDSYSFFKYVQEKYPTHRVIVTTHSLGTGVGSAVSSHFNGDDIACIILAVDAWPSVTRVASMDKEIPLAILSAGQDELIAPHHQTKMRDAANSDNILFLYNDDVTHNAIGGVINSDIEKYTNWYNGSGDYDGKGSCMTRVNK